MNFAGAQVNAGAARAHNFTLEIHILPRTVGAMPALTNVAVHPSQFPENVERQLQDSLRRRQINPKFHYVSHKQARKWMALHEVYSPSRTDMWCEIAYHDSYLAAVGAAKSPRIQLVGLGCGGGQKDARLLYLLKEKGKQVSYAPCDVSLTLVLTASEKARSVVPEIQCQPLICDLAEADDLPDVFDRGTEARLLTFFGMIPNFEPEVIMPRLAALVRPGDLLLFSANLAPGSDYAAGAQKVLPGYDNALTRDWLMTFLLELGVEAGDGAVEFSIEDSPAGLKRIVADYSFAAPRTVAVHTERFEFRPGDKIRLFFSYRYTPDRIGALLKQHRFSILDQWITPSSEEGVFLCAR
jgi:uncharacterized SAM-dependent methyltransferase